MKKKKKKKKKKKIQKKTFQMFSEKLSKKIQIFFSLKIK